MVSTIIKALKCVALASLGLCYCRPILFSVAVLAEISLRSPRKLFIFIINKYICRIKVSKNKSDLILKINFTDLVVSHTELEMRQPSVRPHA